MKDQKKTRIAIFASGSGSNAEKLMQYFSNSPEIEVGALLSNNPNAFALERAKRHGVETFVFNKETFVKSTAVLDYLREEKIDWIILAGFLWLIPEYLIKAFPCRMVNIHPALLPAYGGKGMYGMFVHEAVIKAREKQSGITIHLIDEKYDEGPILFQAVCKIEESDTPEILAHKVQLLEHEHFPRVIEETIKKDQQ